MEKDIYFKRIVDGELDFKLRAFGATNYALIEIKLGSFEIEDGVLVIPIGCLKD